MTIDINNVGSISQALYATTTLEYDEIEAARWQASQVSKISISNCLGRIIIGASRLFEVDFGY